MKSKAKRLDNGKWVKGYYFRFNDRHYISTGTEMIEVDNETTCKQVRDTDFFEGDEVVGGKMGLVGTVAFNPVLMTWYVKFSPSLGAERLSNLIALWKPTGKNIHD